jgi:hypothetical protein
MLLVASVAILPVGVASWIAKRRTAANLKIAMLLLCAAAGIVTVLCLTKLLPASVFWVVSAAVPAWQAWRLMEREDLQQSGEIFSYATRIFLAVMTVALWVPVLWSFR